MESIVIEPVQYAKVVLAIGQELEMGAVDLEGIIDARTVMTISIASTVNKGEPLGERWRDVERLGNEILRLDASKEEILGYI